MSSEICPAPDERFNYPAYLLGLNRGRGEKTAYIDDNGSLDYRHPRCLGAPSRRRLAGGRPAPRGACSVVDARQ